MHPLPSPLLLGPAGALTSYAFTIPGANAESGVGDWTNIEGGPLTISGGSLFTGNAFWTNNAAYCRARHVFYDIPAGWQGTADAGNLKATLRFTYYNPQADRDNALWLMEFWDGAGGTGNCLGYQLFSVTSGPLTSSGGWNAATTPTPVDLVGSCPLGTRSMSFSILANRLDGTALSFLFELNSLVLTVGSSKVAKLFTDFNMTALTGNVGWTITTGSFATRNLEDAGAHWSWVLRYGGSQAALTYYRDLTIPSAALSAIAAGSVTARLKRSAVRANTSDAARISCAFRDSGGTTVSTLQDAATPNIWTNTETYQEFTTAVGSTAVSARLQFEFVRHDGTVLDLDYRLTEVQLEW